ncbi:MAG: hypothetical protein A4E73_01625 [Syntrophaceae bacterium PtaU1.Bin231]|nr:MAG: hypothetical protein A4E73_01625 [Syntrophaceae bacterium PtaU1.Bin231]HOG17231.1 DUF4292 domain-containing protein [Syntrophales bacterium]
MRLLLSLLLLLLSSGCATVTGVEKGESTSYRSPLEALSRIDRLGSDPFILKTSASVEVRAARDRSPMRAVLLVGKPDSFRMESLPVIGPPDFFLSIYRGTLKAYYPLEGKFYRGPATAEGMSRFLPIAISANDLVRVLTGARPEVAGGQVVLKSSVERDFYRVDIASEGRRRQALLIDPRQDRLRRIEVFGALDEILYEAEFEDFQGIDGRLIPKRIELTVNAYGGVKISIRYSDPNLSLGVEAGEDLFDLGSPDGVPVLPLE